MATSEETPPHRIWWRLRVVFDSLNTHVSSEYFFGTRRFYSSPNDQKAQIWDSHRELHWIRALINSRARSIFMSFHLHDRLGLHHDAVNIIIHSLDGQVMADTRVRWKTAMTVQYMDHLCAVHKLKVLVIPVRSYNLSVDYHSSKPICRRLIGWPVY